METILENARLLAARHRPLVVEGAGGLMVPLNESETMLDLAAALGMPVILVGHSGLGTINHTLLSLEALRRRGLQVPGVILNDTRPVAESEEFIHDDNMHAVESFGKVRVLARIPWLGSPPDLDLLDRALGKVTSVIREGSPL
jgi:dethiobiotin synthetase